MNANPADPRARPDATQAMGLWTTPFAGWDPNAATELMSAGACAYDAWHAYVSRVATAATPVAVFEAGAQLMADSLDVCSRAAGSRLRAAGLSAPLLNDA